MTGRQNRSALDGASPSRSGDEDALTELLRQGLAFLRRRYVAILGGALLGAVLAGGVAMMIDDKYRSTLLLLVEEPSRSPIETESANAAMVEAFAEGQTFIIESSNILLEVVRKENLSVVADFQKPEPGWLRQRVSAVTGLVSRLLGGEASEPPGAPGVDPVEAYAVRALREAIYVARRGTNVIEISVSASSPGLAHRVAAAMGTAFADNRERSQRDRAARMANWLDERALDLRRQVLEAEDAVTEFRIANNLITGESGTDLGEQRLTELNSELIATRAALTERRAAFERASTVLTRGGDVRSLPEVQQSEIVDALRISLLDLQRRLAELRRGGVGNTRLDVLEENIAAVEAQIQTEVRRIVERLGNEVSTLEARQALVREAFSAAGGESGVANLASLDLRELERRAEANRELYERYLSNSGLADENVSFLASGVEIIDPASWPNLPYSPPTRAAILFGLIFGAGLGAIFAFLREAVAPGFVTARQVARHLGLPVLACIPRLSRRETQGRFAFDLPRTDPLSHYAEAVRSVRHEIVSAAGQVEAPVILITSAGQNEGKSSLAAALAASGQAGGLSVLLIDADLRRGGLSWMMQMHGDEGLTELVRQETWDLEDAVPGMGLVDILPTGGRLKSPSDILGKPALRRYLADARAHYDLIVIDGPPVSNMVDAPILAQICDCVAFVVRWNQTPRDVVQEALSRLNPDKVCGVILNDVDLSQVAQYGDTYEAYAQRALPLGGGAGPDAVA